MNTSPEATIAYLVPAGPPLHDLMREAVPAGLRLLTPNTADEAEVRSALATADFVITVKMSAERIAAAPKLRMIQLAGVGYDGVDVAAATRAGIPVAQTVAGTIVGVAEHAVLLTLACFKRLPRADRSVREGQWLVWQLRPDSQTLFGKRVGIVGFGRIGREAARRFAAFGTELAFYDPHPPPRDVARDLGARPMALDDLLAWADVVSLHLPLSPKTRGLFDATRLTRMRPTATLINTARGEIIDEPALIEALQNRTIAAAGLDVYADEPPPADSALFALDNVVLTPHIATGTRDSVLEKTKAACDNMLRVLKGTSPDNVINPEVGVALSSD